MTLVDDFASYIGMPSWFAGGIIGLVVITIVLVIAIYKFKAKGLLLAIIVVGLAVLNWQIFYWPFWASLVTGISLIWGLNRGR